MTLQSGEYRPYTKEQWAKIKVLWNLYKENIGLEEDIYLKLVQEGKNLDEINSAIEKHRKGVEDNLETWHSLRKEAQ